MSILFNKKIILKNFILVMIIVISFSTAIQTTSADSVLNPFSPRSVWSVQGIYNFVNPFTPLFLPEQIDDGKTEEERALEKQAQIQNARREARSEFTPLNPIKGVTDAEAAKDPSKFFNGMFMFGISIAAFLAVLMIAIGGIQYMSTDAVDGKSEGKERIQYAVMGLLLVLFSWILLRQINPEILNFNFLNNTTSSYSNPTTGASSRIKSQSGSKINDGSIRYTGNEIKTYFDEQRGYSYQLVGKDKNGKEIRFYPDLQNDPNPQYTIQQSSPQPRQSIKKTDTKDFTEPNEIYNEGIMTDNQRLKRAIDEMNKGIFNN